MPGDHDTAAAGWVVRRLEVGGREPGFVAGILESLGCVVLAYAPEVDDRGGWEQVLCAAGGVLGGAASEELGVAGEEVFVDAEVLFGVGEDGIVGLEVVLGEKILTGMVLVEDEDEGIWLSCTNPSA